MKDIAGGTATDVFSDYDRAGRRSFARFASATGSGIDYAYDQAGRLSSETTFGRALTFQYDSAGNRTRVTWPDAAPNALFVDYTYDLLNRVDQVRENGAASGAGVLADYAYDVRSRRSALARGNGATTGWAYDDASRLITLSQDLPSAANDVTFGLGYTAASQISLRSISNADYDYSTAASTKTYTRNGLNQYTAVSGVAYTHDARGNLTSDGSRTFVYDLENRLTSVSGAGAMTLAYDPLGRLRTTTAGGVTTEFLYDGDRLVAEYVGGSLARRFVHGPGVDEPLVWYEGAGLSDRRWLHTDHQGTIIAAGGESVTRYAYGPYGEPANDTWSGARFRYTGQITLPEAKLYHYKARVYDPVLGRFLQTDPVGYEDDLNLYAYVGNDPGNYRDPTGRRPYDEEAEVNGTAWTLSVDPPPDPVDKLGFEGEVQLTMELLGADIAMAPMAMATQGRSAGGRRIASVPIYGRPQVTLRGGKPSGHRVASARVGIAMARSGKYNSIHFNQRISTITGGKAKSGLQPDVAGVRPDGKIDVTEKSSLRGDEFDDYARNRTRDLREALGNYAGDIKIEQTRTAADIKTGTRTRR